MPKKNWDQFDWSAPLTTSASALMQYRTCPRSWVLERVWRLKTPGIPAGPFGDTVHEACMRYLLGDERGIGPDGEPVEVFPKGWDHELNLMESTLAKVLVEKAIEEGIIRREPGTTPESPFQRDVCAGVSIMGYGDVIGTDRYEDHKTTKSFRYCETRESLAENVQMIIGAAEAITRSLEAGVQIKQIRIAHNYFLKDPQNPTVKQVDADLTVDYVKQFWLEGVEVEEKDGSKRWVVGIVPTCEEMLEVKKRFPTQIADVEEIEGPRVKGACQKYRGCPFQGICTGTETIEGYKDRMKMVEAMTSPTKQTAERSYDNVSIFDRLRKERGVSEPTKIETEITETKTVEPTAAEKNAAVTVKAESRPVDDEPDVIESNSAPWAMEDCVSCSENPFPGFNTKGEPCRACAANWPGQLTEYAQTVDGTTLVLTHKEGGTTYRVLDFVKPAAKKKGKDPAPPKKVGRPKKTTPTPPEKARENIAKNEAPKAPGRPKSGFTLIYGAVKRGKRNVKDLNVVLMEKGTELAEALGKKSYYDLDFGQRRDHIASRAALIAEELGSAYVVVTNMQDPDVRAFATAIEPYAAYVIVPTTV